MRARAGLEHAALVRRKPDELGALERPRAERRDRVGRPARAREQGPERLDVEAPRRLYVESLGTLLARTRRPADAVAPLRARALESAELVGLPADERRLLESGPRTPAELLRYGRAAAALERRARRLR